MTTIGEVAQQFKVHPSQVTLWKKQLLAGAEQAFEGSSSKTAKSNEPDAAELYEQIGRLKVELEWLKKSCREPLPRHLRGRVYEYFLSEFACAESKKGSGRKSAL